MKNLQKAPNELLVNRLIMLVRYVTGATFAINPPWEKAEKREKELEKVKEELLRRLSISSTLKP